MKPIEVKVAVLGLGSILKSIPMINKLSGSTLISEIDWGAIEKLGYESAKGFLGWRDPETKRNPILDPLKPQGPGWVRHEWATNIAREEGASIAGVQLMGCVDPKTGRIPVSIMNIVMGSGIMIEGIDWTPNADGKACGWVRYITQAAKSNEAVLPVSDYRWARGMTEMFPDAGDIVRPGALHSPLRGGYYRVAANILVTGDDDRRYKFVGDGQGMADPRWYAANGIKFDSDPQFRALIGLNLPWSERVLGKGTLKTARLPDGIDMVLPVGCLKHNKAVVLEVNKVYRFEMGFGIMNGDEPQSGPIHIGPQVWQWAEANVVAAAHDLVASDLDSLSKKINDVQWLAANELKLRKDDGEVEQAFEIVKAMALVCVKLGDTKLMRTKMVVKALEEYVAKAGYNILTSLGTKAWRFRAVCNRAMNDNVIAISPKMFRKLFGAGRKGAVATVAIRYPFADRSEAVAVKVVADPRVRNYEAHVNGLTMNRAALDFDGDTLSILVDHEHVLAFRKTVENMPLVAEKVRQKAKPPSSRAVMATQSMAAGIGLIDYAIQRWVAVWHLQPDRRARAEEVIAALRIELQKAVDSIKKAATADMELVKALSAEAEVAKASHFYRQLQKRQDVRPFMKYKGDELAAMQLHQEVFRCGKEDAPVVRLPAEPGQYVMPSRFFSQDDSEMTPLASLISRHEDEVPLIGSAVLSNKMFSKWIELIPGDGQVWADKVLGRWHKAIADIGRDEDSGKFTADVIKERREALYELYRNLWKTKVAQQKEDVEWLRSAASAVWADFTRSESAGFALKASLPDVIAEMLIERKEMISMLGDGGQVGFILGGQTFRKNYMDSDVEDMVLDVVQLPGGKHTVSFRGGDAHELTKVILPTGKHLATVSTTAGRSLSVVFKSSNVENTFALDLDGGEVPEPDWDNGVEPDIDEVYVDDGYMPDDVM